MKTEYERWNDELAGKRPYSLAVRIAIIAGGAALAWGVIALAMWRPVL